MSYDPAASKTILPAPHAVAQHNALVNGRYSLLPLQKRLFVALLARIDADDRELQECFIPTAELISGKSKSIHQGGGAYRGVEEMCQTIMGVQLQVEAFEDERRQRQRKPLFTTVNLMRLATYNSRQGGVLAQFHEDMGPYLLQLRQCGHYTRADLDELRKFQSLYALRLYWLLKEYRDFGQRTIEYDKLHFMLGIEPGEYQKMTNFRRQVLDRAQQELAHTDLPFTYELQREGRVVKWVKFVFSSTAAKARQAIHMAPEADWALQLSGLGLSQRSILVVAQQLADEVYTTDYIGYVLARVKRMVDYQFSTNPPALIAKALQEAFWLDDFHKPAQLAARIVAAPPPAACPVRAPGLNKSTSVSNVAAHDILGLG